MSKGRLVERGLWRGVDDVGIDEEGVGLRVNNLHHNLEASRFPSGRKSASTASRTAESHRRKGSLVERGL